MAKRTTLPMRLGAVERGQTSILMAVVAALVLVAIGGLATIGSAMVSRARATTAADTVVLAQAADPIAGTAIADWYRTRGLAIDVTETTDAATEAPLIAAQALGDPGRAQSWAIPANEAVTVAPALRAVIARAGQLAGVDLQPLGFEGNQVELTRADAAAIEGLAPRLRLCRVATHSTSSTWVVCAS